MPEAHPDPSKKGPKKHLDYAPRPTTFIRRNRPELMGTLTRCPEHGSERQAAGETNTESQIVR